MAKSMFSADFANKLWTWTWYILLFRVLTHSVD